MPCHLLDFGVCAEVSAEAKEMEGGGRRQNKRGLWTEEEDKILVEYVEVHGKGQWNRIAKKTGLKRCGKSCRLRWVNYLSPNVKRGDFTEEEEDLIIRLHKLLGNRWSLIAGRVPGRTDNQVKNYWNTHLSKRNGCAKRQRTEACSKDSETITVETLATPTPLSSNHSVTVTTENAEKETSAMDINVIGDASSIPQMACSVWSDEEANMRSSYESLMQFSDEFFQFDFGWSSSFFSD